MAFPGSSLYPLLLLSANACPVPVQVLAGINTRQPFNRSLEVACAPQSRLFPKVSILGYFTGSTGVQFGAPGRSSQSVDPRPAVQASPDTHENGQSPRNQKILVEVPRGGPSNLHFNRPPGRFCGRLRFENHACPGLLVPSPLCNVLLFACIPLEFWCLKQNFTHMYYYFNHFRRI